MANWEIPKLNGHNTTFYIMVYIYLSLSLSPSVCIFFHQAMIDYQGVLLANHHHPPSSLCGYS